MEHDLCYVLYDIDIVVNCDNFGVGGSLTGSGKKSFFIPECHNWALIKAYSLGQFSNAIKIS